MVHPYVHSLTCSTHQRNFQDSLHSWRVFLVSFVKWEIQLHRSWTEDEKENDGGGGEGFSLPFSPCPLPHHFVLTSVQLSCSCNSYFANHKRKNTPKNHQLYIQATLRDIILRWNIKTITHYFCCWWCFSSKTLHWSSVSMAENKTTVTKNKTPYLNYPFSLSSRYIPLYLIPPHPSPCLTLEWNPLT